MAFEIDPRAIDPKLYIIHPQVGIYFRPKPAQVDPDLVRRDFRRRRAWHDCQAAVANNRYNRMRPPR